MELSRAATKDSGCGNSTPRTEDPANPESVARRYTRFRGHGWRDEPAEREAVFEVIGDQARPSHRRIGFPSKQSGYPAADTSTSMVNLNAESGEAATVQQSPAEWSADALRQHSVVPVVYRDRSNDSFENEGILFDELFGRSARSEDRHVAKIHERSDADHLSPRDEPIDHRFVSREHGHDGLHRDAGRFADYDRLHHSLL
jgi:hypothetical protein